jgi:chitodextrinase
MIGPAFRRLLVALAVAALAACHSSGGDDTPPDTAAPSTPVGVVAAPSGPTAVNVTWNSVTDSGGSGLKDYVVYRGDLAIAFVTTTSYSDAGLTASTHYSYQIAARDNANNESSRSPAVNVTTLAAPDTTPPLVPSGVVTTSVQAASVAIAWSAATDLGGSGLREYRVYRNNGLLATVAGTTYTDTTVTASTRYVYQVSARDNADNESSLSAVLAVTTPAPADTTPPSIPSGLMTTSVQTTAVALAWSSATDTGGSGLRDYRVYRNDVVLATVTDTTYNDTTVAATTQYSYEVSARDNANNESSRSAVLAVTTRAPPDLAPPSVPSGLMTTSVQSAAVALGWSATADTGGSGLRDYRVFRNNVLLATVTGTAYNDTTVAERTSYSYQVSARDNADNESSRSAALAVTTPAAPDTTPPSVPAGLTTTAAESTAVSLAWSTATDSGSGLRDYRVYRDDTLLAIVTGTTYDDATVVPATQYSYQVSASDNADNESSRSAAVPVATPPDTTEPSVPAGLMTTSIQPTAVGLTWTAATDSGGSGLHDYRVYRDSVLLANVTGTAYNDTTVTAGTQYSYRVSARDNANNESNRSAALVVTTLTTADTTQPSVPTGLMTTSVQATSIALAWNPASDTGGSGLRDYRVYRDNTSLATVKGTSYSDTTVSPLTQYSYEVSATDNSNNESSRSTALAVSTPADTTPPSVPTGFTTTSVQSTSVALTWNAATDTGGSGLRDYRVYRDNTVLATVTGTTYNDTAAAPSTQHTYQVSARDNADNESNRATLAVTTPADTTSPSVPTGLTPTSVQSTSVALAWNAASDTGGSGLHDYRVYRDNALLATIASTSYVDTTAVPSSQYSYQVSARDNANNESNRTGAMTVTTPADTTPPSVPTGLTSWANESTVVELGWNAATDAGGSGLRDYRVYRDNTVLVTVTTTSFSDTTVAPATQYTYQVSARDNANNESSRSASSGVTTPTDTAPPSAPTGFVATAVQSTSVSLAWNAASDTGGSGLRDYRVYRDNAFVASVIGSTSYTDTTVAPSTQYSYKVSANDNANNESSPSTPITVTTPADTTPPSVPTGLATTAVQSTAVALAWNAATDTGGAGLRDYLVYRDNALLATVTGTTYNDTTVMPTTQYSYRVSASDNANNESSRSTALAVTTPADAAPPSVPTGLTTTAVQSTAVALAWNAATDTGGSGLKDYRVYRDAVLLATVTGTTYNDTTVAPSTQYSYQISARDNANNESARSTALPVTPPADTTPPSVPTGFTTTAIQSTSVALSWNVATDTGGSGLRDYRVYRDNTLVATVTGTSYSDTTVAPSSQYSYQVSARDNSNNESGRSTALSVTTAADTTSPSVPTGLTTTAILSTSVALSWNAAADTGGSGLHDYRVYRDNVLLATVTGTSYSDTTVDPSMQYSYQVSARDYADNESFRSTALGVATPDDTDPPSVPSGLHTTAVQSTVVSLTWNAPADTGGAGVHDYRVYRDDTLVATVSGTNYDDTTVAPNTQYSYQVSARDNADNESGRSTALVVTTPADTGPPSVPTGLTTTAVESTAVELAWNATTDTGGSGLQDYRVYRDNTLVATVTGTSYSDTTVAPSTQYSYQLSARDNANNESSRSTALPVTTPADTTAPSVPTGLTTTSIQSTTVALAWNAATDTGGSGVKDYRVYRDDMLLATVTGTSYSDATVAPSMHYSYQVSARDNADNESSRSTALPVTTPADTAAPSAPTGLTTTSVESTAVALAWNVATDTGGSGLKDYRVYRDDTLLATVTGTTYNDTTVAPATQHAYQISARDNADNESSRSAALAVTTPADTTAPSVPTGLTTTSVQSTAVTLTWNVATDAGGSGLHDYRVYRDSTLLATVTGNTYSDTTVAPSTQYSYQISARDNANNESGRSTAASLTTPADTTPPSAPTGFTTTSTQSTSVALAWTAATDTGGSGVHDYHVYRDNTLLATVTGTTYSDTTVAPNTQYSYEVSARDNADNESSRSALSVSTPADATPPSVPTGLSTTSIQSTSVALTWDAATDAGGSGLRDYRVYRDNALLATVAGTTYTDTAVAPSTQYSYQVSARDNANNESSRSTVLAVTTLGDTTPPSVPTGLITTTVQQTSVALAWNAATDTGGSGLRDYRVYRDNVLLGIVIGTTYTDVTVVGNTQYSYEVAARDNANNESSRSTAVVVNTPAPADTTPPTAPGPLTATPASSSHIDVSWGPATDNVAVTGYLVERCTGTECTSFAQIAAPTGTSYTDTGRTAATSYSYRVRATDAASNLGAFSNTSTATTTAGTSSGAFQNEVLITGMNLPTALHFLPDGDMLILELGGKIWLVPAGTSQVAATPFLELTNIGGLNNQQGLMGMTLDPDFENNHYYYVFYTRGSPNRDRVSRFTVTDDHSGTVPDSEFVVYQDPRDAEAEHHGGALNFGGDGKLYITTGEQFGSSDAQSLTNPRGKLLRVNADGSVPTDNPFYDGAGPNRDDIWALGLRNPFRAFYDSPSGRLYIADVGGNDYSTAQEEVHLGVAGANYGWPNCEGSSCGSDPTYTSPIYSYPHLGRDASITGGFIYRGSQFPPEYYGNYFFADYSQNWIRRLTFDASGNVSGDFPFEPPDGSADGPYGDIVYLTEGPDGALYYVDLGFSDTTGETGVSKIRRIRFIPDDLPPTAAAAGVPTEGTTAPLTVNFSSAGSADPEGQPLSYLWTFGDGATSNLATATHVYSQLGAYTARLTVSDGTSATTSAPVQITVGNRPVPAITSPPDNSLFRGGDAVAITGDATDVEDGALPASAFAWTVDFLHSGHVHPGVPTTGTKSFVFPIASTGHDFSGDTRYRVTLTVTDSNGIKSSRSVTIYPEKVNLSFDSLPSGLAIEIDGLPHTTPYVHDTLINFTHTIAAPNQFVGATLNTFASWSDGGAQQHMIVVPAVDRSYTATFTVTTPQHPPGLVGGYRLDEGVGSTTDDISGNGATGTLVDAPIWTAGRYNGALTFGGTSYVDLGNPVPLRLTGSMTLSAWINISANPGDDGAIVAKLGSAGWQLKTSADTGVRTAAIQLSSNGSDSIQRYSAGVLTAGNWYHLAGVYDAAARTLDIYVNGVFDNGVLSGSVPAAQFNAPFNVNIAQRAGSPGTFNFLGRIDEVHIFNRALTASEIQTDMNLPR